MVSHCLARIHQIWMKHCLQEVESLLCSDYLPSERVHLQDRWVGSPLCILLLQGCPIFLSVKKVHRDKRRQPNKLYKNYSIF